ncbi:hypothetical protein JKP88DRAFT_284940 [Tribonema minus]|uniref:Uncharacterized protein n=1 Tax=Tribonema minus TaxID=303371 RepID=A0A835ZCA2_9STRA|nr:hypothetical protein JKP88DRAFT_284940 [Tribonema minus]
MVRIGLAVTHSAEIFGSLEGHSPHNLGRDASKYQDLANMRAHMLVMRRLLLIVAGGAGLAQGLTCALYPKGGAQLLPVDAATALLCEGAQPVVVLAGAVTAQIAALQLMMVWFGDDRTVKCAVRMLGTQLTLGSLALLRQLAKSGWAGLSPGGRAALVCWPVTIAACALFGRQL